MDIQTQRPVGPVSKGYPETRATPDRPAEPEDDGTAVSPLFPPNRLPDRAADFEHEPERNVAIFDFTLSL